jgi:hypothetical protein
MYKDAHDIVGHIYDFFLSKIKEGVIPIKLESSAIIGTVQDDPFDNYIIKILKNNFRDLEFIDSGKLSSPDTIIRYKEKNIIVGLEIKKLTQTKTNSDPRGATIDFNSCVPCGRMQVEVKAEIIDVPCYYLFCLLNQTNTNIQTLVLADGDFINSDYNLHKESKTSNYSDHGHGAYLEGSVRHRKMYMYPNPLNTKIKEFSFKKILLIKDSVLNNNFNHHVSHKIIRADLYGRKKTYLLIDGCSDDTNLPVVIEDVFAGCKDRVRRERRKLIPKIED